VDRRSDRPARRVAQPLQRLAVRRTRDLKKPLLTPTGRRPASRSRWEAVWAEPAGDGQGTNDRILVLAWTDQVVGTIETVPAPVTVVR
jgi:hypothetical protein